MTWTVIDASGNASSATQTVTLTDDTNPIITAPDAVSVSTNDGCTATEVSLGSATTNDNCSVASVSNDAPSAFEIGENTVTWTVTDESGNTSTDTQQVIVIDESGPTVICNDITLTLENGIAEISSEDIDNGSFDECGGDINFSISQSSFNESHIGDNTIILTATDQYGNSSTCQSTLTIEAGMGIDDNTLANIFLYPNPVIDKLFIQGLSNPTKISVYDVLGKLVLSKTTSSEINVDNLQNGIYILKIVDNQKEIVRKFIKN